MTVATKSDGKMIPFIMVIHENEIYNKTICRFLQANGYEAQSVLNFEDARRIMGAKAFDSILVDSLSTSFDAFAVNSLARKSPLNHKAKIYMLGGRADSSHKSISRQLIEKRGLDAHAGFTQLLSALKNEIIVPEVALDVRIINAFVDAAEEVYQFYFHKQPERSSLSFREQGLPEFSYCTGVIELGGEGLLGSLGVGLSAPAVKVIAEAMFKDIAIVFDNSFIGDITGEMCNQVLGRAKINCDKLSVNVNIGLPKVYVGKSHIVQYSVTGPVVSIMIGKGTSSFELQFVLTHQSIKIDDERENNHPMGVIDIIDGSGN